MMIAVGILTRLGEYCKVCLEKAVCITNVDFDTMQLSKHTAGVRWTPPPGPYTGGRLGGDLRSASQVDPSTRPVYRGEGGVGGRG